MLEMFLCVLEEELQIEVNRQRAPIARMSRIMKKLESLTRAAELKRAPVQSEQKCPFCLGSGFSENRGTPYTCDMCNGTGISNRSDGG